ncbi:RING-H2 finger protein ATL57-like [Phalaenopsis equestris]|uniref:RING-H2 finger protein ATL57-like n=1 Tax=Phalaenopsis equestris TaxID=78828 RepID=UPI0009E3BAFA|nr:RING-H2 finger protein ATL57-like [Phalaenopsis equestris]
MFDNCEPNTGKVNTAGRQLSSMCVMAVQQSFVRVMFRLRKEGISFTTQFSISVMAFQHFMMSGRSRKDDALGIVVLTTKRKRMAYAIADFAIVDMTNYYKRVHDEQLLCIFCLSEIGEGEQVRKLNCSHLFHRSCFDKWLEYRRTSCPLCRCSLILLEAKTEQHDEEIEDEEVEDSATPLLAFVQREWWGVVHPSG